MAVGMSCNCSPVLTAPPWVRQGPADPRPGMDPLGGAGRIRSWTRASPCQVPGSSRLHLRCFLHLSYGQPCRPYTHLTRLSERLTKIIDIQALAGELTWLECHPKVPRLRVRSLTRAHTRSKQ